MEKEYINFKQEREFGDILNATFQFIGQEFKPLGQVILIYVLPFIILTSVLMGVFFNNTFSWMELIETQGEFVPNLGNMFGQMGAVWLLSLISYLFLILGIYSYISLYVEKGKGNFQKEDVWKRMTENLLQTAVTGILVTLIVFIGFIFCIIPGIYFSVSLSIIFIILIHEKAGFSHAFSRSFDLTKLQWWWTLLLIIVVGLITAILSGIISFPLMIGMAAKGIHSAIEGEVPTDMFGTFSIVYIVFANIVSFLLYTIPYVALSLQYFNLVEISEKPSLIERIMSINKEGGDENKTNNPE